MDIPEPTSPSAAEPNLPFPLMSSWPIQLRDFFSRHVELIFVILIGFIAGAIFYLFPYKIAFLNFFYLPVLAAAYFMGKRKAMLGGILCILVAALFCILHPKWFAVDGSRLNALMLVSSWGGFLILTSAAVGSLQERLAKGFAETRQLYEELKRSRVIEEMKEKVERTLYSTMDPVVAKLATDGKLRIEKREISIMFTDLTNFTTYSDQSRPDVVLDDLNRFLGEMEPIVELFRGHIDKYMGDGMMVEFGAPVDYDRHALLSVLAGIKMQEKAKSLDLPWRLRVGIASGSTVIGMMGARRQAYSAIGDRVNIAKRLEEICLPESIYVDEPTFQEIEPFVNATKVRNLGYGRQTDRGLMEHLNLLEEKLVGEGESPRLLYEIGKIYFELRDASTAIQCFERALLLDPSSTEIKLAYADASIKKEEFEKIQLKGKIQKVTVYEIRGIRDRWSNPAVIPPPLAQKYAAVESQIEIPEDVVLSVEALDGSVGYSRVVALLSYAIADHMKLNDELKKIILHAGYLQDIGRQAVSHHILNRAGTLTEQEMRLVEKYVLESVAILKRMGYVDPRLLEIVQHHHESWAGGGYPGNLRGEAIPLGARITAVAEAYSSLTAWRPYREAWNARVALTEIRKATERGKYDPNILKVLVEVLDPGA